MCACVCVFVCGCVRDYLLIHACVFWGFLHPMTNIFKDTHDPETVYSPEDNKCFNCFPIIEIKY